MRSQGSHTVGSFICGGEWESIQLEVLTKNTAIVHLGVHPTSHQETRNKLFQTYIENNRSTDAVEAKFQAMLIESTKTSLRYGFRNDIWLRKHHGDRKAESIMKRKELGLFLSYMIYVFPVCWTSDLHTFPKARPPIQGHSIHRSQLHRSVLRQGQFQTSPASCFTGSWWNSTWMTSRNCEG